MSLLPRDALLSRLFFLPLTARLLVSHVFFRQVGKNLKVPEDAVVVDATGKYVIPGRGHANGGTSIGEPTARALQATAELTDALVFANIN